MLEILTNPIILRALMAALTASILSAVMGTFIVLRKISSLGAAIAHMSFAGAMLSYVFGVPPILGATALSLSLSLVVAYARRTKGEYAESVLGAAFGISSAIAALALAASREYSSVAFTYLIGDVLGVSTEELVVLLFATLVLFTIIVLVYKELKYSTLDPETAEAMGLRVTVYEYLFNTLAAVTLVVEIRVVGLILAEVYMVAPAAAALEFAHSVEGMIALALILAVVSVIGGFTASFVLNAPLSAAVGLIIASIYMLALGISPKRRGKCAAVLGRGKRRTIARLK